MPIFFGTMESCGSFKGTTLHKNIFCQGQTSFFPLKHKKYNLMNHSVETSCSKRHSILRSSTIRFSLKLSVIQAADTFQLVLFGRRTIRTAKPFDILLKLGFGDGCKCLYAEIKIPVDFQVRK